MSSAKKQRPMKLRWNIAHAHYGGAVLNTWHRRTSAFGEKKKLESSWCHTVGNVQMMWNCHWVIVAEIFFITRTRRQSSLVNVSFCKASVHISVGSCACTNHKHNKFLNTIVIIQFVFEFWMKCFDIVFDDYINLFSGDLSSYLKSVSGIYRYPLLYSLSDQCSWLLMMK